MRNLINLVCVCLFMLAACRQHTSVQRAEQYLAVLNDNQAKMLLSIDGKPFYPSESIFNCQFIGSRDVLNLTLTDQFNGRTILTLAKNEWYARQVFSEVNAGGLGTTSLKIGKLTDPVNLVGEGYMMTKGNIAAVAFDKDKVIFEIKGEVGKYSDFRAPDRTFPLEAVIVCKKPAISLRDITEKEVFGSTHSNQ